MSTSRNTVRSSMAFERAKRFIVGGVNSPARAFNAVGGKPVVIQRGAGARITDVDGNEYIDYVCSWGPLIAGHAPPRVIAALDSAMRKGTSFGAPTEVETELAELVVQLVPSIELVRFVNSGTEATMSALRLARGYTGRSMVIKFEGCYHGHGDSFLVKAGSGLATSGIGSSAGVPQGVVSDTIVLPYNDIEAFRRVVEERHRDIAAVIVEPVAANMGVVLPRKGFLEEMRELTRRYGIILIFDEVITGFRLAPGGAQELLGVIPDLTCLGKVIGGGLPVGAYGGRREIMEKAAPLGPVYQAGTLSGNPLAMTAGLETIKLLLEDNSYARLNSAGGMLARGLREALVKAGLPFRVNHIGSILTLFFSPEPVEDYASAARSDVNKFAKYFNMMLDHGIYLPCSQFEAYFVSLAHTDDDLRRTVAVATEVLKKL